MRREGWAGALCFLLLAGTAQAETIRVCVRPPNVLPDVERWAYTTGTAALLTTDAEVSGMKAHGQSIYVFDPAAPQENAQLFPIPYNKLRCSARVLPTRLPELPSLDPKKDAATKADKMEPRGDQGSPKDAAPDPLLKPIPQESPEEREAERHRPSVVAQQTRLGEVLPRRTVLPYTSNLPAKEKVLPYRSTLLSTQKVLSDTTVLPEKRADSAISSAGTGKGGGGADPSGGADARGVYGSPLPRVGGYGPPGPHHVAILWVGAPYGPEDFRFKVVRKWDKKDGAGGRQIADKLFVFIVRDVETREVTGGWKCPIEVMIPVHVLTLPEEEREISPERAAMVTAGVANIAVPAVSHSQVDWTGISAVFCNDLRVMMNKVFDKTYPAYGGRVTRWNK